VADFSIFYKRLPEVVDEGSPPARAGPPTSRAGSSHRPWSKVLQVQCLAAGRERVLQPTHSDSPRALEHAKSKVK
jgi:hypothetical protein